MVNPTKLLILEDHAEDAELMVRELQRSGFELDWLRVDTLHDFRGSLDPPPDLIFADYSLPGWNALQALHVLRELDLDIPFVVVTGTVEEEAIECMKQGADDYILKDSIGRLNQVVTKAMEEKALRIEKAAMQVSLARSHSRLLALSKASENVQRAQTPDEIYHTVGQVMQEMGYYAIVLTVPKDQDYAVISYLNYPSEMLDEIERPNAKLIKDLRFPFVGDNYLQRVVQAGTGVYTGEFTEVLDMVLPEAIRVIDPQDIRSLGLERGITVPMLTDGRITRFLNVNGPDLEPSDLPAIDTFARQINAALDNVQFLEETRRRFHELEAIARVSNSLRAAKTRAEMPPIILDQLGQLLNAEGVMLGMLGEQDHELQIELGVGSFGDWTGRSLNLDVGILGHTVNSGEMINIPKLSEAPKFLQVGFNDGDTAILCTPLKAEEFTVGALLLSRQSPFIYVDQRIVSAIADMAANALNRAEVMETLERRVFERTEELEIVNRRLEQLVRMKDEFVSNVSHELRTPITSLKFYNRLAKDTAERREEYLVRMDRETSRLANIIEDLLRLSRLDQGREDISFEPVDLRQVAATLIIDRGPIAEEAGIELITPDPMSPAVVEVDSSMIGQALSILLTNAINYTPKGGQITVSTKQMELENTHWLGLSVQDTGPGIPAEEQVQLFERFFRGRVGRESGVPGTGLGLAIVKEIVDRHAGRVEVRSEGVPGKGSEFILWFPETGPQRDPI